MKAVLSLLVLLAVLLSGCTGLPPKGDAGAPPLIKPPADAAEAILIARDLARRDRWGAAIEILRQQGFEIVLIGGKRQAVKKKPEVQIGLQPVGLGRFDQGKKGSTRLGSLRGTGKQPVLPAEDKWTNRIFGNVIVGLHEADFSIDDQSIPLIQRVLNRLAQQTLGRHQRMMGIQPDLESV